MIAWQLFLLLLPFLAVAVVGLADWILYKFDRKTISTIVREWSRRSYCIPLLIALIWGFIDGALFIHWFFYRN